VFTIYYFAEISTGESQINLGDACTFQNLRQKEKEGNLPIGNQPWHGFKIKLLITGIAL